MAIRLHDSHLRGGWLGLADALADLSAAMPALPSLLYHLLLAFVLATPVAWVYARTHQGASYSRSFVQSLVLLPLIVTVVMMAIGDSLARAFGLFGVLFLLFCRYLPMIAIAEVKSVMPEANPHWEGYAKGHGHQTHGGQAHGGAPAGAAPAFQDPRPGQP